MTHGGPGAGGRGKGPEGGRLQDQSALLRGRFWDTILRDVPLRLCGDHHAVTTTTGDTGAPTPKWSAIPKEEAREPSILSSS